MLHLQNVTLDNIAKRIKREKMRIVVYGAFDPPSGFSIP